MPTDWKTYRIFLSSPGGLQAEVDCIKQFVDKYNRQEANCRNVNFLAVHWDDLPRGYGRAQGQINEKLVECDYFVLILCDRWGSPPGAGKYGSYTSGTEEEFCLAMRCCKDDAFPMQDVVVYFKSVDSFRLQRLKDSDDLNQEDRQLKRVLDFKSQLRVAGELFYGEFGHTGELEDRVWADLGKWKRDHEDRLAFQGVKTVHDIEDLPS